jgi:hypothetical protein
MKPDNRSESGKVERFFIGQAVDVPVGHGVRQSCSTSGGFDAAAVLTELKMRETLSRNVATIADGEGAIS